MKIAIPVALILVATLVFIFYVNYRMSDSPSVPVEAGSIETDHSKIPLQCELEATQ